MSSLYFVGSRLALLTLLLSTNAILAQSPLTLLTNVQISFANNGTHTQFTVSSPLGNRVQLANSWLAIGLNSNSKMAGASSVVCKNLAPTPSVEHYLNGQGTISYLDLTNPTIGISGASMVVDQSNNIVCRFTRANSNANTNYYNLNAGSPYVLAAYGAISDGSEFELVLISAIKMVTV